MHFAYLVNGLPEIYPKISLGQESTQNEKTEYAIFSWIKWFMQHRLFQRS